MDKKVNPSEFKKSEDFTTASIVVVILFLISAITLMILCVNGDILEKNIKKQDPPVLSSTYYQYINPWGDTQNISQPNTKNIDTSKFNWFTYENTLGIVKKPSISTAVEDFENGFSHLSETQTCFDEDQLVFKTGKRTCDGKGSADCIGSLGERYNRGEVQELNISGTGQGIPPCTSTIGSLSFNFLQTQDNSPIDSGTRFMTFEKIFVSPKNLELLDGDKKTQFYTQEGSLFFTNSILNPKDEEFFPLIRYLGKQDSDFKQNIKLVRYSFSNGYVLDEKGPYAEILFRPYSLYLTALFNNTKGQIEILEGVLPAGSDDYTPVQDSYTLSDKIRRLYLSGNEIDTTCTCNIIGGKLDISVYKRGTQSIQANSRLTVEGDNGEKTLGVNVSSTTYFSTFLTLSKNSKKWLLVPPLDIGGGKVMPREDRSQYVASLNGPPISSAWYKYSDRVSPYGPPRKDGNALSNALDGRDPLTTFGTNLFKTKNIEVNSNTSVLFRSILENRPQTDTNLLPTSGAPGTCVWWEIVENDKHDQVGVVHSNDKILVTNINFGSSLTNLGNSNSGMIYPNNFLEPFLKSVGKNNGFLDPSSSPFYSIQPWLGYKDDFQRISSFETWDRYKAMLSYFMVTTKGFSVKPGQKITDGQVTWQVTNPLGQVNVFGAEYFLDSNKEGFSVTDFVVNTSAGNIPNYKQDLKGYVVSLDYSNYQISGSFQTDGSYSNLKLTGSGSTGSGSTINVTVTQGSITSVTVVTQGSGYQDGDIGSFSIPVQGKDSIEVSNLIISASDRLYFYPAFAKNYAGQDIYKEDESGPVNKIMSFGFLLDQTKLTIVNGNIKLNDKPSNCIISGGYGYNTGDQIGINQVDQDGNSTVDPDLSKKAYSIFNVTSVDTETGTIKSGNLISNQVPIDKEIPSDYFSYNFYVADPSQTESFSYGKSPQQIAYIPDEEEKNMNSVITTGTTKQITDYIFRVSPGGVTNNVGLFTLQFPRLNYYPDTLYDQTRNNTISIRENLVIGKFIPYSSYYSETMTTTRKVFVYGVPVTEKIPPVKTYTYQIYNVNNCRFVPMAISQIYTRNIKDSSIPTF